MATEGDITASSIVSLFAVRETGGTTVPETALQVRETAAVVEEEEEVLPGPPPIPETLNTIQRQDIRPFVPRARPGQTPDTRKTFQPRPIAQNLSLDPTSTALPASLFGTDTTERPPNLTGPTQDMLDQNGKPYTCYNCGRPNHIASGCKYQSPMDGVDGDKPRALRRVESSYRAADWIPDIMAQGLPDPQYFGSQPYCMILSEAVATWDRNCEVFDMDTPGGN
jgi:hypothetical protein